MHRVSMHFHPAKTGRSIAPLRARWRIGDGARVDLATMLRELERIAREAGWPVRYARMRTSDDGLRGGRCRVGGAPMIVCDGALPTVDKVVIVARALAAERVEVAFLPPLLRRISRRARG